MQTFHIIADGPTAHHVQIFGPDGQPVTDAVDRVAFEVDAGGLCIAKLTVFATVDLRVPTEVVEVPTEVQPETVESSG